MNRLKRNLRKSMNIIKKQYKAALSASKLKEQPLTDSEKAANIWLTDNFRLLEKISSWLFGYIKSGSVTESSPEVEEAYRVCFEMCENGILPSTSEVISYLLSRKISLSALLQLEFFTAAALIAHTAEGTASSPSQCINAIKSLNRLPDTDFKKILNEVSGTEKILCQDPTGEYRMMTDETKSMYRLAVCRTAEKDGITEIEAAVNALEKAMAERRHIGFFLDIEQDKSKQGRLILILENLLPLAAAWAVSHRSLPRFTDTVNRRRYLAFSSLSLYLPLREIMKHMGNAAASKISRPAPLPKMDYGKGIPHSEKTVIAVVSILPKAEKAQDMGRHLKELMMSNCRDSTVICLLADLRAAQTPETKNDSEDLKAMTEVINSLNEICPDKVVLALRPREYSSREDEWVGRDRKRGAVTALVKLIADGENQFKIIGNAQILKGAKYLMVLDSDTEMPFGNLKLLVGAASHPLNRPQFKYSRNKAEIASGYGIITPKIEALPGKTKFSRVMSQGGLSYYNTVSGEKYQNLFGKSIFTGKGLINIEAYRRLLTESPLLPDAVLSHDIIEGIIMRTGFSGDISLTESFPANEISYYNRLHRWVRGDIQNIPFLFKGLDLLGKYWITDNIARILTPISSAFLLIGPAVKPFFGKKSYYTALIVLLSQILPEGLKLISSGNLNEGKRAFYNLIMLFHTAYINADGAVRAVYRMIRRKNLLQWTTAEQSEAKGTNTVKNHFISSLPSEIAGLTLIGSSLKNAQILNSVLKSGGKRLLLSASGTAAALDFPLSLTSSKEAETKVHISESDAEKLKAYCLDMWRFYTEYSAARDNYLIPDNVQELPVQRTAHRTSPTNIGLMLCVFLAARDFGFITSEELCSRLDKSLEAVESLPKFKGNLYNWYDTESLSVLTPEYVSTVDSGNFLCCLTALKEGLKEYLSECGGLENIIARCERLTAECDLGFLYDRQRDLFYIGYDKASASFSQSHYDLLMSEARMTSYFAAAAEIVPVSHWQALSRTLSKDGKYTGPISWTGTMFEYFMPSIFLPAYEDTVESNGLKLCIHAQKKSVKRLNIPYGISESGFYAFDDELNYQYKAHGVPSIALKHIPQKETVISPYSTFLTLPMDPKEAMENLARLEDMGLYGKFGFYEAADFTSERKDGRDFSVVKSFMSHHIGMSFLAAANCIFDGIMQKRFISDSKILGGKSMLQEKIPRNMKIIEPERENNAPVKPRRAVKSKTEISDISIDEPNCKILSNGELSLLLSDSGASVLLYKESSVFALRRNPTVYPSGIFAAVKMASGKVIPFTAAPLLREEKQYTAKFTDCSAVYKNRDSSISCTETAAVHRTLPCEIRIFKIRNRTKSRKSASLMIYAEPLFSDINFADTHPAFSRLFVTAKYSDKDKALIFTKNEKDGNRQVFLAMGFSDKSDFSYCLDREAVLPPNSGIYGLFTKNYENNSQSADKCAAMEIKFSIQPKAAVSATLLTCVGSNEKEALSALKSARSKRTDTLTEYAGCPFSSGSITEIYADKLIERIFFGRQMPPSAKRAAQKNKSDFSVLWQSSISGDYPIIAANVPETNGDSDLSSVIPLVKLHSGLRLMGIRTELVFLYPYEDDYFNSLKAEIKKSLLKGEPFGIGKKGGIFIINPKNKSEQFINLLKAVSYEIYPPRNAK
ncbi:MAG: hypothetical protein LUH40_05385 [Clostridiales bacterium]|nr:hypothetical protein [Clostridiales bacterium]